MQTSNSLRPRLMLAGILLLASSLLAGCGQQPAAVTLADKAAFAPGMTNLSPEAKAAMEKNEIALRAKQAQAAQPRR